MCKDESSVPLLPKVSASYLGLLFEALNACEKLMSTNLVEEYSRGWLCVCLLLLTPTSQ
jgi:hypothetical protein